jgi:hypothetical protein
MFALKNATANFTLRLQNCSAAMSPTSAFLGRFSLSSLTESTTDLSFTLSAAALALAGRRYGATPYRVLFIDGFSYNPANLSCIREHNQTTNMTTATIACQADSFNYLANLTIANLNRTAVWYEKVNKYLNASCNAPNVTSVQNLTHQWHNLTAAFSAYSNIYFLNKTLMEYANATLGMNITRTFYLTQELIESFKNATACLIEAACNNNAIVSASTWADFSWLSYWNNFYNQRASFRTLNERSSSIQEIYTDMYNGVVYMKKVASGRVVIAMHGIRIYYTATTAYVDAMFSFVATTKLLEISAVVNETEYTKLFTINKATLAVNASVTNLATEIIAQGSNFPKCKVSFQAVAIFFANFSTDVQTCGAIADADHNLAFINVSNYTMNITALYNFHANATSKCYILYCYESEYAEWKVDCLVDKKRFTVTATKYIFFTLYYFPTHSQLGLQFVDCINNVSTQH